MTLRVAYDVSVLGLGHYHSRARTGVFRVVENVAHGLARAHTTRLSLCATHSLPFHDAASAYLANDQLLRQLPMLAPEGNALVGQVRARLQQALFTLQGDLVPPRLPTKGLLGRVTRSALYRVTPQLQRLAHPVGPAAFRDVDVFHSPFYAIPASLQTDRRLGKVLTIYDLIPILFPQYFDDPGIAAMIRAAMASLGGDGIALCISEATKRDLCEHLKLPPERAVVTHLAASALFTPTHDDEQLRAVRARYHIPDGPYLLSLCTLEPRKNIEHSIRCFLQVIEQERIPDLNLVLVGTKGWDYDRIFAALAAGSRHANRVIVTGFVADGDLAAIYSGARAFIYPSLYEGFGLPVLEAMQCGTPVITSNTSSIPEVVGDAGIMLAPTDVDGMCAAIERLYRDDAFRAVLASRSLARAKLFSWDRCVAETVAAYQRCVDTR